MVSIINKVDLKPLNEELYARPKIPEYLIMSNETYKAILAHQHIQEPEGKMLYTSDNCPIYRGVRIAICNRVPYGMIDIKD